MVQRDIDFITGLDRSTPSSARFSGSSTLPSAASSRFTSPACAPLLLPVAGAGRGDRTFLGGVLMGAFGLARSIPTVVAATTAGSFAQLASLHRLTLSAERLGAALIGLRGRPKSQVSNQVVNRDIEARRCESAEVDCCRLYLQAKQSTGHGKFCGRIATATQPVRQDGRPSGSLAVRDPRRN